MELIDWLKHWDEMRFYYWSGLSWFILLPIYLVQLVGFAVLWWILEKYVAKVWIPLAATAVLLPVAAIWPWVEELNIAYNFGQLCKKDAGIFIYKTVETDGFYDATAGLLQIQQPLPEATSKAFDERGYKFYEMSLADAKSGPTKVAHFEKINGEWIGKVLDYPTAQYHYKMVAFHKPESHGVKKFENVVVDSETNAVLGQYVNYYREAPWFFVGLDRPTIPCRETQQATRRYGSLIYSSVLKPNGR